MSRFKDESWEARQYFGEVQIKVVDKKGAEGRRVGFSRNMDDAIAISLMPDMYNALCKMQAICMTFANRSEVTESQREAFNLDSEGIGELLAKARGEK